MRLKDKVAIVTGASRGIGAAIAAAYAQEGAHVVLAARTQDDLEEVAEKVRAFDRDAAAVVTDVTDEESVQNMVQTALDRFGRIDILVNNAGSAMLRHVHRTSLETWNWLIGVNLTGPFLCTKHAWPALLEAGGGAIINIGSTSGSRAYPLMSAYSASKWGLVGLTKSTSAEGRTHNIRVNCVNPGKVSGAGIRAQIKDEDPLLELEDMAGICIFLASDEAKHIHGQVIEIEHAPEDKVSRRRKEREAAKLNGNSDGGR